VISVGNISAGGTGKTPFVSMLARELVRSGRRVAVVSRGYGRRSKGMLVVSDGAVQTHDVSQTGDEPLELAASLPGVCVVVDEDRARGSEYAVSTLNAGVVVLDDGFQHRSISRDADIVLLPASDLARRQFLLPAGYMREPMRGLNRASLVVISQCERFDDFERSKFALGGLGGVPLAATRTVPTGLKDLSTREGVPVEWITGKRIAVLAGMARPGRFERTIVNLGGEIVRRFWYGDHHWYTPGDLQAVRISLQETGVDAVVTTMKDAIRLGWGDRPLEIAPGIRFLGIEIAAEMLAGAEHLEEILGSALKSSVIIDRGKTPA